MSYLTFLFYPSPNLSLYLACLALPHSLLHRARPLIVPASITPVPLRHAYTAAPSRSRFVRPRLTLRSVSSYSLFSFFFDLAIFSCRCSARSRPPFRNPDAAITPAYTRPPTPRVVWRAVSPVAAPSPHPQLSPAPPSITPAHPRDSSTPAEVCAQSSDCGQSHFQLGGDDEHHPRITTESDQHNPEQLRRTITQLTYFNFPSRTD